MSKPNVPRPIINPLSPSLSSSQINSSHQIRLKALDRPKDARLVHCQLAPLFNCPLLLNFVYYVSLPHLASSTYYIHIITPLRFSIISCYQFALINTTFLLPLIIISTHQSLKSWPEKIRIRNLPLKRPFRRNDLPLLNLLAQHPKQLLRKMTKKSKPLLPNTNSTFKLVMNV